MSSNAIDIFNGYRYLFVFIVGFIGDIIIHGLSHYNILARSLIYYYNSLSQVWYKSIFLGGFLGGLACLFALVVADIILFIWEQKKPKNTK